MTPGRPPTTRAERLAAGRQWRSLPYPVRRRVVAAARRGHRHPDPGAVEIGRRYAETLLRPRGPHWWSRHWVHTVWRLALAALLAGETAWLRSRGVPWSHAWVLPVVAYMLFGLALFSEGLRWTLRRMVVAGATGRGITAERPRSA